MRLDSRTRNNTDARFGGRIERLEPRQLLCSVTANDLSSPISQLVQPTDEVGSCFDADCSATGVASLNTDAGADAVLVDQVMKSLPDRGMRAKDSRPRAPLAMSRAPVAPLQAAAGRRIPRAPLGNPMHLAIDDPVFPPDVEPLTTEEVAQLLRRAAAASASEDAIIAVVDRGGRILGVRIEDGVPIPAADTETMVFAIDGALAKARTAAFFANNQAPLSSRLIRFISQSTVSLREVESTPNSTDENARGPGFVAPIGVGGHFPPEIDHTPLVDLFAIEHTNRDTTIHPGEDHIITDEDPELDGRFNEAELDGLIEPPDSYGFVSGQMRNAQPRGIATLPGGIPIFKKQKVVGGIGVFFPGEQGFATFEQAFASNVGKPKKQRQSEKDRTNAPRVLEAEYIAFAAAGGIGEDFIKDLRLDPALNIGDIRFDNGTPNNPDDDEIVPDIPDIELPAGRLTLVGIELEVFGPHPRGLDAIVRVKNEVGTGDPATQHPFPIMFADGTGEEQPLGEAVTDLVRDGKVVPEGWLVKPKASADGTISAADVEHIISNAIIEAKLVRAAIRLPFGQRTKMVFSVADKSGNILGLFRMPDATVFSIDVAVAKARNTAYYADPDALQEEDRVDVRDPAVAGFPLPAPAALLPPGIAMTNRTFRFLADPRFPDGVDGTFPGPFSLINDINGFALATDPALRLDVQELVDLAGSDVGQPGIPFGTFTSVLGFDAFNPGTNFRDPDDIENQNGIVFFPGSTPLYKSGQLVGGLGVSGDGVDQDDVVTFSAAQGFLPPDSILRADDDAAKVRRVRLPFIKFLRNPRQ